MNLPAISYKRHRFPPQIIAHAVWLYFRFPLSLRLVEEMLLERGIVVSYETVRRWAMKFGPSYARRLRRKTPSPHDIWHLDEVVISIAGQQHWLWRAVDQDGYVFDEIVQTRRDTKAAKRLLKRLLKRQGCPPRRMITDKLGSYAATRPQIMPAVEHRSHKGLNNRAENSHLPLRKRERMMQGFRSTGGLQRFTSVFSAMRNLFVPLPSVCPCYPPSPSPGLGSVESRGRCSRLKPVKHGLLRSPQVYVTSPGSARSWPWTASRPDWRCLCRDD